MKKFVSMAAALVLALSLLIVPAGAVVTSPKITIKPNGQPLEPANRFAAYQIFSGEIGTEKEELVDLKWGIGVHHTALINDMKTDSTHVMLDGQTLGKVFSAAYTEWSSQHSRELDEPEFVAQWLAEHRNSPEFADYFARLAAKHITGLISGESKTENGNWEIMVPTSGYYLIIDRYGDEGITDPNENNADGSVSSYILEVLDSAEVVLKGTSPVVEKKVEGLDGHLAGTDETVYFTLTGSVAENLSEYDKYEYTFTDTLSEGLTMTQTDLSRLKVELLYKGQVKGTFPKVTPGTLWDAGYTVELSSEPAPSAHTLTVKFTDLKAAIEHINALLIGDAANISIRVTYAAEMNEYAVAGSAGNPNKVTLEYSNDPYSDGKGESVPDEVKTYTLGLKIVKHDEKDQPMQSVKFILAKRMSVFPNPQGTWSYAQLNLVMRNSSAGGQQAYYEISAWVPDAADATEIVTDASGSFSLHGLEIATYRLEETETLPDYEIMKPVVFTVESADPDGIEIDGSLHAQIQIDKETLSDHRADVSWNQFNLSADNAQLTLRNFPSPILPHTGGIGAGIILAVSACAVLFGGAAVFMTRKKKKE